MDALIYHGQFVSSPSSRQIRLPSRSTCLQDSFPVWTGQLTCPFFESTGLISLTSHLSFTPTVLGYLRPQDVWIDSSRSLIYIVRNLRYTRQSRWVEITLSSGSVIYLVNHTNIGSFWNKCFCLLHDYTGHPTWNTWGLHIRTPCTIP